MQSFKQIINKQLIISLSGEMKFDDRTSFWEYVKLLQTPDIDTMVIDFSELKFMDSAGLALILNANDQIAGMDKTIILQNPKGQVAQMFSMSNISELFQLRRQ